MTNRTITLHYNHNFESNPKQHQSLFISAYVGDIAGFLSFKFSESSKGGVHTDGISYSRNGRTTFMGLRFDCEKPRASP
jgi:hypothetical protein